MSYVIISLKHGSSTEPTFWRSNNAGYTTSPFLAGKYTEEQIQSDPDYYNDGYNSIAVPLTNAVLHKIEFKCSFNESELVNHHKTSKI